MANSVVYILSVFVCAHSFRALYPTIPLRRPLSQSPKLQPRPLLRTELHFKEKDEPIVVGRNKTAVSAFADFDFDNPFPMDEKAGAFNMTNLMKSVGTFRELATPYFTESENGRTAILTVLGLTLLNSGVSVLFSYVGRDFMSSLNSKDTAEFGVMLQKYAAVLIGCVPVSVIYRYQREKLCLNWREWMTTRVLNLYKRNRVYYNIERSPSSTLIDNPDQRITEDIRSFTTFSLTILITLTRSVIDLLSYSAILYSIKPDLFLVIVGYSIFGTVVTSAIGGKLVPLNFNQLQREANLRYSLVRIRENAESIAFYGGEELEIKGVVERLEGVVENAMAVITQSRNLEFFTTSYSYLIQILPVSAVAPLYFAGTIPLGVVTQTTGAFNHILNDLSIVVNSFEGLSAFSAGVERLGEFLEAIRNFDGERVDDEGSIMSFEDVSGEKNEADKAVKKTGEREIVNVSGNKIATTTDSLSPAVIFSCDDLTIKTPDLQRTLVSGLTVKLKPSSNLLIVGSSGSGKSSLLRTIAGLWDGGSGSISRPKLNEVFFLPQKPYCTVGSLRDNLLYPCIISEDMVCDYADDDKLLRVLDEVGLHDLAARCAQEGVDRQDGLNTVKDWTNILSLGEQQRLR